MERTITNSHDFHVLYRTGRRFLSPHFSFHWKSTTSKEFQYAIVIPNHIVPLAVKRNFIRRRIKSILHASEGGLVGIRCIISVCVDVSRKPFRDVKEEVEHLFKNIRRN